MANYLLAYKGGALGTTEAEQKQAIEAWGAWFGQLGQAVVDGGNPIGASASVASNGTVSDGAASGISGYSILKAESLAAASAMAKACPILSSGGSIEVYETFNAM
jgi:hypothetical protein